jgi:hypothetical protein
MQKSSYDKNKISQEKRLRVQLTVIPTRPATPDQGNNTNCKDRLNFNKQLRLQLNLGLELDLKLRFPRAKSKQTNSIHNQIITNRNE